jgi:hypothetical protein
MARMVTKRQECKTRKYEMKRQEPSVKVSDFLRCDMLCHCTSISDVWKDHTAFTFGVERSRSICLVLNIRNYDPSNCLALLTQPQIIPFHETSIS